MSLAELRNLPVAERLAIIDDLWTSIGETDLELESGHVEEAQARWEELKSNPALGLTFDELKKRLG